MLDEGNAPSMTETPDAPPPEEKNNRTFLIVGGVMGGLVFLTLVCMAVYFLVLAPRITAQRTCRPGDDRSRECPGFTAVDSNSPGRSLFTHSADFTLAAGNRYEGTQYTSCQSHPRHCGEHPGCHPYQ